MVIYSKSLLHSAHSAIGRIASIGLKAKEPGLIAVAQQLGVPLVTFSAEALCAVEGSVAQSTFVEKTVGVDCVCERAALVGSGGGTLLLSKQAKDGVTLAVAQTNEQYHF